MSILLLLALEGLILALLGVDLEADFQFITPWGRPVLVLLGVAAALPIARPGIGRGPWPRRAFLALATGTALLGVLGSVVAWRTGRVQAGWEVGARARLEARATVLQEDFAGFLRDMVRPVAALDPRMSGGATGFATIARLCRSVRLPVERYGLALYDSGGNLLAWDGNSTPPPPDLLRAAGAAPRFQVAGGDFTPRLFATGLVAGGEVRWVVEFVLTPPEVGGAGGPPAPRLEFLPRWGLVAPARFQARGDPLEGGELARFFERHGDRHWRWPGPLGTATLTIPLRTDMGEPLVVATLPDVSPAARVAAMRAGGRRAGAVLAATSLLLVLALLMSRSAGMGGTALLVAGTAGIWSARVFLLLLSAGSALPRIPFYDITVYSSTALGGLIRSPADVLMTALASLGQAALLRRALGNRRPPEAPSAKRRLRVGAATGGLLLAVAGLLGMHALLHQMVLDARLDISRVEIDARFLPRLALQAALFALVAAAAITVTALFDLARRCRGETEGSATRLRLDPGPGGRLPNALRAAGAVVLLTLLYVPFLQHAYERLRRDFFEKDLVQRVLFQSTRRLEILRQALLGARDPEFAAGASFALDGIDAEGGDAGGAAYRLWIDTPMARMGLASSLQIFGGDGSLLSRFAVNLAPMLEVPFPSAAASAGGDPVRLSPRPDQTVRQVIVYGSVWVHAPPRPRLLVVMSVIEDYDNVPMLGAETTSLPLLRARTLTLTNPELARHDPMLAVFGPGLERRYESGGEIPPPGPVTLAALERRPSVWTTDGVGEGRARIVYFRGAREIFALAYAQPDLVGRLAAFLRLVLLNGLLTAGLSALVWVGSRAARRRAHGPGPGTTFYGRLTAVFLLTALVPLLALATFVTRFSGREFDRGLMSSGLASLQVARRVIEDYLTVSSPEDATLDDDALFWLGRVVGQEINVFQGADLLATSSRELYTSALLNTRLDGSVYRALIVEREPFRQAAARLGEFDYLTMSAPIRIDRSGATGIISIPLAAQRRAVARKVEQVEDTVLISTCLTIVLLAAVGWQVARRISGPIALLGRAARRVEQGDLDVQVRSGARDEVGLLVASFNRMARALRDQREDLRRRKDYIEKILASATTGVVSLDAAGTLITINPAAQNLMSGESGPPVPGDNLLDRLGREAALRPLHAAVAEALAGGPDREIELALSRGAGERRLRAVFLRFTAEAGGAAGRIVLLEDVTDIMRSGRLAAWAEMARRIAHDVKNPLTPILLSVQHARRVWRAGDARRDAVLEECLDNIQKQVEVLRRIASEFSDYARLPQLRAAPTPVRAIVDAALGAYAKVAPPGMTVRDEVAPGLPEILVDRAVIVRALVNLIENALQAMPGGGTLSISAAAVNGPAGAARVRIDVRDTGVGIEPSVLARLFEPYFSTRSGGTGLGLAIARKAIEEHGGKIEIASRPGAGTVVTLLLPAAPTAPGDGA